MNQAHLINVVFDGVSFAWLYGVWHAHWGVWAMIYEVWWGRGECVSDSICAKGNIEVLWLPQCSTQWQTRHANMHAGNLLWFATVSVFPIDDTIIQKIILMASIIPEFHTFFLSHISFLYVKIIQFMFSDISFDISLKKNYWTQHVNNSTTFFNDTGKRIIKLGLFAWSYHYGH